MIVQGSDVAVSELLLSYGISEDTAAQYQDAGTDKKVALHEASKKGHLDVVKFLAKECEGVDLNAKDRVRRSGLVICICGAGWLSCVLQDGRTALLLQNQNPDFVIWPTLHFIGADNRGHAPCSPEQTCACHRHSAPTRLVFALPECADAAYVLAATAFPGWR